MKQPAACKSLSRFRCRPLTFLSVNLTAWSTWSLSSRCAFAESRMGHWMVTSCGGCVAPPASPMKHGATLHDQLAGNARRADTPLARSIPALGREWGRLVTTGDALCCCFKWFSSRARTCNRFLHFSFVTQETRASSIFGAVVWPFSNPERKH